MSKYESLTDHLKSRAQARVPMSFAEIEKVLGFGLPRSSRIHRAWWSNNPSNNVMTRAWINAGYRTEQVDIETGNVVFKKDKAESGDAPAQHPKRKGPHPLFGALKGTTIIPPGVDITEPDPDLVKLYED